MIEIIYVTATLLLLGFWVYSFNELLKLQVSPHWMKLLGAVLLIIAPPIGIVICWILIIQQKKITIT